MVSLVEMLELLRKFPIMDLATLENSLRKFTREALGVFSKMIRKDYPKGEITDLLFLAIEKDSYKTVELLLLSGADYEEERRVDFIRTTPLILASKLNQPRIMSLLLKYGANPNHITSFVGNSPLIEAIVRHDNPLLIQLLLDAGANIDIESTVISPIMKAVDLYKYKIANYLLDRGAYTIDQMNDVILIVAVFANVPNLDIIRRLIEHGANLDAVNTDDRKAIDIAKEYYPKNEELLYLLTSYKGDYIRERRRVLLEHMIPDLSNITMKYLD